MFLSQIWPWNFIKILCPFNKIYNTQRSKISQGQDIQEVKPYDVTSHSYSILHVLNYPTLNIDALHPVLNPLWRPCKPFTLTVSSSTQQQYCQWFMKMTPSPGTAKALFANPAFTWSPNKHSMWLSMFVPWLLDTRMLVLTSNPALSFCWLANKLGTCRQSPQRDVHEVWHLLDMPLFLVLTITILWI